MGTDNGNGMGLNSQVQKEEKKIEQENDDEDEDKEKGIPVDVQGGLVSARGRGSRGGERSRERFHLRKQSPHFGPPP